MDEEITQEQKKQLTSWAEQRDALLLEISNLEQAKERIKKENKGLTDSYTDTNNQMNIIKGRIEELKIKEAELPLLISKDVANLESKKKSLETQIVSLNKVVATLTEQKTSLEKDVSFSLSTLEKSKNDTLLLDKVVGHVTSVSEKNVKVIDDLMEGVTKSLEEIIDVNKKNVFETNVVINEVPRMLMELQKSGLIKQRQGIIKNND